MSDSTGSAAATGIRGEWQEWADQSRRTLPQMAASAGIPSLDAAHSDGSRTVRATHRSLRSSGSFLASVGTGVIRTALRQSGIISAEVVVLVVVVLLRTAVRKSTTVAAG